MKMKTAFLLLALSAVLAAPMAAQFVYDPDSSPSTGGGNYWPFGFSSTTGRFIEILDAKTLSTQVPGPWKVTEVAFSHNSGSPSTATSFSAKQFQMRMEHTTFYCSPGTNFAAVIGPCPINLMDIQAGGLTYNFPAKNQWVDIGTTCDFGWDGKRNIALEIRYRGRGTNRLAMWSASNMPRLWANTSSDNYNATTANLSSCSLGLKVRLTIDRRCICIAPDTAKIGTAVPIQLVQMPGGQFYQIAASRGQAPIILSNNCHLCLTIDNIFLYSILIGPPIFINYSGVISAAGTATGRFNVPNSTVLVGMCVFHAGIAFGPVGITCCTNTDSTVLVP